MASDTVTLPSGQVMTLGRARALGLVDADGVLTTKPEPGSAAAQVLEQDARRSAWDQSQGIQAELDAVAAEQERIRIANGGEPQIDASGNLKPLRKIRVARPRNVTKEGDPVEDEETLAKIAAETAALEASKAAD